MGLMRLALPAIGVAALVLPAAAPKEPRELFPRIALAMNGAAASVHPGNELAHSCEEQTLTSARTAFDQGRLDAALKVLRARASTCSDSAEYHDLIGLVLQKQGHLSQAAKEIYTAIQLSPHDSSQSYYFKLAEILFQNQAYGEARALLMRANKEFPREIWTYLFLAEVYRKFGSEGEAEALLRKAVDLWPNSVQAHVLLGNCLAARLRDSEAIVEYKKAIELNPRLPEAYLFYGMELAKANQPEKAIAILEKCASLDPKMPNVHYYLGTLNLKQGKVQEAIRELRLTLQLDPTYALACFQLGKAYQKMGDRAKARDLFAQYGKLSVKQKSDALAKDKSFYEALTKP